MVDKKPPTNSAVQVGLRLLAKRALSTGELHSKLRQRGFTDAAIELALTTTQHYGYLNDEKLIGHIIEQAQNRGRGTRWIHHTLQRRQLAQSNLAGHLLPCQATEEQTALQALKKRFSSLADQQSKLRAYRFLASRGFTSSIAQAALRAYDQSTNTSNKE